METKTITTTFKRYKQSLLFTALFFSMAIFSNSIIKCFFSNVTLPSIVGILILALVIGLTIAYIALLVYSYKLAKILKIAGKMKIKPSLLLILMILSTNILFLINIIIFVNLFNKTTAYLKETSQIR